MAPPIPKIITKSGYYLLGKNRLLDYLMRSIYATGMETYVRLRTWWNFRHYDMYIDPFEVIYVDPGDINTHLPDADRPMYACDIRGGNWDKNTEPFANYHGYRGFVQHFEHGIPWEETEIYEEALDRIGHDKEIWSYSDMDSFRNHLEKTDELYAEIKKEGYKSQTELAEERDYIENVGGLPIGIDEIRVAIGRDGELILLDGRHRLFCTKILGVDKIPVRVVVRHEKWQTKRDAIKEEDVDLSRDHPDIHAF